jgi:hypothetical protein
MVLLYIYSIRHKIALPKKIVQDFVGIFSNVDESGRVVRAMMKLTGKQLI